MNKIKEYLKSPHIQIAMAAGFSIILIACATKWILLKPIDPLLLTIPALAEVAYEGLLKKYSSAKFMKTWIWVCTILFSTLLIISMQMLL